MLAMRKSADREETCYISLEGLAIPVGNLVCSSGKTTGLMLQSRELRQGIRICITKSRSLATVSRAVGTNVAFERLSLPKLESHEEVQAKSRLELWAQRAFIKWANENVLSS